MAAPRTLEEGILSPARSLILDSVRSVPANQRDEALLQVLEAAASLVGGFSFEWYSKLVLDGAPRFVLDIEVVAIKLVDLLRTLPIPPPIALSSLAQPHLSSSERRTAGVYYTDFRLAAHLVRGLGRRRATNPLIVDPACGTGILLVAAVLALAKSNSKRRNELLRNNVFGADLSARALRGAALALSSLTDDKSTIASLLTHLRQGDSLVSGLALWEDLQIASFDVVVGNPPWEKLKVSRHEFLRASGVDRHYGADYEETPSRNGLAHTRQSLDGYVEKLNKLYGLQGRGEHDLYKFFLELAVQLTKPGGQFLLLVPAGLIRSLGTRALREFLFESCSNIEFTLMENRARFFSIDTRFKFLAVQAEIANGHRRQPIKLTPAVGDHNGIRIQGCVSLGRAALAETRPDLSLPEVRSREEWDVFCDISRRGLRFGDAQGPWRPVLMREVDMTRDRRFFKKREASGTVPLIEGRMIHQFRHSVKCYRSGTGRRAVWVPVNQNKPCCFKPQFYFPLENLPPLVRDRAVKARVGFCDITGQTNERTMLAARIPANVICGNKVPTIVFDGRAPQRQMRDCWLAIVNSLPFDWLLRRVVTTTVNYFLLLDLPMPSFDPSEQHAADLARLAAMLSSCQHDHSDGVTPWGGWEAAGLRAEMDWRVLHAYGHGLHTMRSMIEDFPLLDRSQRPIQGERRSTVTRDFLLLRTAEGLSEGTPGQVAEWRSRVEAARAVGAVPYVPSHLDLASAPRSGDLDGEHFDGEA